ncbi:uncharacterized protein [Amphiura filiformis]|uniref:uncharacterized protein n=1 Tax=Amphiura filiformis TaxID=82378 RepID=UPI003B222FA6
MDSLQQYYTHPDAMRDANRKKQNSLMHKELNNYERVISHALGRFKLDMWYNMLSQIVPESVEINSIAALQDLVQQQKEQLQETGEDPHDNIAIMYFRDFFRDVGQLRRMKDIFHARIYSVLFEYYYDVDAIQEISDVAKSVEENNNHKGDGTSPMSKVKKKNLSQIQQQEQVGSRFPPEIVAELAGDCIEISGLIGELKRLVFSWGRLLNDPDIEPQLFSSGNDQFEEYDDYQRFEGVFRFVPDILQKSHQAIVLARNWWFKAEKIQHRLSKLPPPPSRMVSGKDKALTQTMLDDDDDSIDYDEDGSIADEFNEDKLQYSDDFNEDDIVEDFGESTLSDEDDMFLKSDPGAIVLTKNSKTPSAHDNNENKDEFDNEKDNKHEIEDNVFSDNHDNDPDNPDNDAYGKDPDADEVEATLDEVDKAQDRAKEGDGNANKHGIGVKKNKNLRKNRANAGKEDAGTKNKKTTDAGKKKKAKSNASKKPKSKQSSPRKPKPPRPPSEHPELKFATESPQVENETGELMTMEKLKELNENIDAHQRELDIQIEELQGLCDRNHRVKSLCETLEETIENQVSQRKKAQELMTVKESLEELKIQETTTPDKQKKIDKHLEMINKELDQLLQSGKLREYQNELLTEDLDLQLAVSPRLVLYGNQVQDQIEALEEQLEREREKLAALHQEYNLVSRKSRLEHRQQARLKAAERDGKSFSADAVNKTRNEDVARNRKEQKPAHHSDGSAGGTPRDSHQSASSGSVFLNEGDVEEFDEEEFGDEFDIEESLENEIGESLENENEEFVENDSGMSESWEEIGKASHDLPRTPAPPPPPAAKNNKTRKKTRGRPNRGANEKQPKPVENEATKQNNVKEKQPAAAKQRKAAPKNKSSQPDDQATKNNDKQSKKGGNGNKNSPDKSQSKGVKKESPKKNKVDTRPKEQLEQQDEDIEEAIDGEHSDPFEDDVEKIETEHSGLGLFGSQYRYPDSDALDDEDNNTKPSDPKSNIEKMEPKTDSEEESRSDHKKTKESKKGEKGVKKSKENRQKTKESRTHRDEAIDSEDEQEDIKGSPKKTSKPQASKKTRKAAQSKEYKSTKDVQSDEAVDPEGDQKDVKDSPKKGSKPQASRKTRKAAQSKENKSTKDVQSDEAVDPEGDQKDVKDSPKKGSKPQANRKTRKAAQSKGNKSTKEVQSEDASEEAEESPGDAKPMDNNSKKPPAGSNKNHQPKPPTNKSNRARTRARAAQAKDVSTSDEEIAAQEQQGKTKRRGPRHRDASKGKRTRSLSRGRAEDRQEKSEKDVMDSDQENEQKTEKKEENEKQADNERKNTDGGNGAKDGKAKKKDERPPWKPNFSK